MNLDLSKASGPDCITVVVLKNCEPVLSLILPDFFNKCLKESCFPDFQVSSVVPVFKNVGERYTAKNYCPVSPLYVVRMLGKGLQLKTTALLVLFMWLVKSLKNL